MTQTTTPILSLRDEDWKTARAEIRRVSETLDFPVWVLIDDSVEIIGTDQISEMAKISGHWVLEEATLCFDEQEIATAAWDRWFSL